MIGRPTTRALPVNVKLAAALFLVYGVAAVLNATAVQSGAGWGGTGEIPRAILRLAGSGLIAWGLLHGARWAWQLGLALAAFWLVMGAVAVLIIERGDVHWLPPSGFQLVLTVSLLCLGLALALLLTPSARAVFRRPAA